MEVSGKTKFRCHPCAREGDDRKAAGFCKDCMEYLCIDCYKSHRKPAPCRQHVLLDRDHMPKDNNSRISVKPDCTQVCLKHAPQIVIFFCKVHDEVGCTNCMILNHKPCDVKFIPDIAVDFKDSDDYSKLMERFKHIKGSIKSAKKEAEEDLKEVEELYKKAVNDIRAFRLEIESYLDNIEHKLLERCEKLRLDNAAHFKTTKKDLRAMKRELDDMYSQLTSQTKDLGDLFVHAKQKNHDFHNIDEQLKIIAAYDPQMYIFEKNNRIVYSLEKESSFGELKAVNARTKNMIHQRSLGEHFTPLCVEEIRLRSETGKTKNRITAIVALEPDTIVVSDYDNNSVNIVKKDKIISELKLGSGPYDATRVSDNSLAVASGSKQKIYMLSYTNDVLSRLNSFNVDGECVGVTAYNNKTLIVSFLDPPKVEILSIYGNVQERIDKDSAGKAIFHCPRYIAVDCKNRCLYVADTLEHLVIKVSISGQVLSEYQDENLVNPRGIAVCDDGSVLVCNYGNDNLHLISPECVKIRILLKETKKPRVVCMRREKKGLVVYVSSDKGKGDAILKCKFD